MLAHMGRVANETLSGLKWGMLQKMTLQPLQLVYSAFLARLLTPTEMGITGLTSLFFAVAGVLASAGFGTALIRKIDRTEDDINTMFWFNLVMSGLMALLLWCAAPWFVAFFRQPLLLWLTRISAVMMFLNSSASVHWCLYSCRRDFKTPAIVNTVTALIGMPVCLVLAYYDFGVWALSIQGVVVGFANLGIVWVISPWKPSFRFSTSSFKELFSFGGKLALSGVIDTAYAECRSLIIGRFYSPAELAFYQRGAHLSAVAPTTVCSMLGGVLLPVLSTLQKEPDRLREVYRRYLRLFTMTVTWFCFLMAALSESFVAFMYGDQWGAAVPYCRVICLSYALYHIQVINLNLLQVKGRSDLFLRLEIIKKIIGVSMLIAMASISVFAICCGSVVISVACVFINSYYTKEEINMSVWQQLGDYAPIAGMAALCTWGPAYLCNYLPCKAFFRLAIGGTLSFVCYFGLLYALKSTTLNLLLRLMKERVGWAPLNRLFTKLHNPELD